MPLIKRAKPPIQDIQQDIQEGQQSVECEQLLRQLNADDEGERRMAARELASCCELSADSNSAHSNYSNSNYSNSNYSEALCQRLIIEESSSVRAALFNSLTQRGDAEAVATFVELLRSEDAELRNGSIAALKCLPDQTARHISILLQDQDADVRIFTINILEALPHPDVPLWLSQVIAEEQHVNVCAAALDLLAEQGTPEMVPALLAVQERFAETPYIAFVVDLTVERINAARVIDITLSN